MAWRSSGSTNDELISNLKRKCTVLVVAHCVCVTEQEPPVRTEERICSVESCVDATFIRVFLFLLTQAKRIPLLGVVFSWRLSLARRCAFVLSQNK